MKAKVFGDSTAKFAVNVSVRCAGGYYDEANLYYVDSLLQAFQIEQDLIYFRSAMAKFKGIASSSRYLFGGNFRPHSNEWIVCHTFFIEIFDLETGESVSKYTLQHPYLEKIENSVN